MREKLSEMISEGYVISEDLSLFERMERSELIGKMYTGKPNERSASIRILVNREGLTLEITERLMELFMIEKSRYTKIEISEQLKKAKEEQIRVMTEYLGSYEEKKKNGVLKNEDKKKKPNDPVAKLIAELGNASVVPLLETVKNKKDKSVCVAMATLSYLYANELVTENKEATHILMEILKQENKPEELRYQIVRLMEFMDEEQVISELMELRWSDSSSKVKAESGKTLLAIYERNNKLERERDKAKKGYYLKDNSKGA